MKCNSRCLCSILLVFIVVACSQKINDDSLVININPNNAKPIELSEWCKSIELIQLETTPESILASCSKIIEYKDRYYILDYQQNIIFVYEKNGKCVFNTKDLKGKGPHEYAKMVDFNINMQNDKIEILDAPSRKIKIYNLDGSFNRVISLSPKLLPLGNFSPLTKDIYVFYTKGGQQRDESLLFYSLKSKKIKRKTGKIQNNAQYLPTTMNVPFRNINEQVHFNYTFPTNDIYLVDKDLLDVINIFEFDFGGYNFTIDDLPGKRKKEFYRKFMRDNNDKYAFIINVSENEEILIVHFLLEDKVFIAKINKVTRNKTICFNDYNSKEQLPPPHIMNNNVLTYVCEPSYLKYVTSEELMDSTSRDIASNICKKDNPVIVRYKLRSKKDEYNEH